MNILFPALLMVLAGCSGWDSLKPGVDRVCTTNICYMRGTREQIDRHCRKKVVRFDDGTPCSETDGRTIVACIKKTGPKRKRFQIWLSDPKYIPHEMCHLEEFVSGRNEHWRCNRFGFDDERSRPR